MAINVPISQTDIQEKEIDFAKLRRAPQELKESQLQIAQAEMRFKRRDITNDIDPDVLSGLEEQLRRMVEGWREDRTGLTRKLREWNDLYEGVVTETDFPWVGSSQTHIPIPKIKVREIKSAIQRNTMRPVPFLHATFAGPDVRMSDYEDFVFDIEDFVEDKIKNSTNVWQTLSEAHIPTMRDGTCPIQIVWYTEWERVFDFKTYETSEEFEKDYPDPSSAGVSQQRYNQFIEGLNLGRSIEIQYEYDVATYDGPKAYIVPLIDFFHWPTYVGTIEDTVAHGKRVWLTEGMVLNMFNMKKFNNEELVMSVINTSGDERTDDDWTRSRDAIEGISREKNKQDSKEFEFFELIWKGSLTEKDKEQNVKRKYLIWFREKNPGGIFRIEPYPIRKGRSPYFPLRYIKRDGRLLGMSFMDDIADLSLEVDIVHRMRINSRTITHVPTFKAKASAKGRFDPSDYRFRFRPGATYWLEDVNDVAQFDIRPVDLSGSVDEELLLLDYINQVLGSIGQSGQANPIDPRAPARKEQQQLRQSTNRIDDYVAELLPDYAAIGQHFLDLYYQNGPNRIKFFVEDKDGNLIEKQIERTKLFNPNVMFRVNGTSIFMSPDLEFARMQEIYAILAQDPVTAQNPRIRRDVLGRLLRAGRVPDLKRFLPRDEEIGVDSKGKIPSEQEMEFENRRKAQEQRESAKLAEQELRQQGEIEKELVRVEGQRSLTPPNVTVSPNGRTNTPTGGTA